jgi:hypothetical protein
MKNQRGVAPRKGQHARRVKREPRATVTSSAAYLALSVDGPPDTSIVAK